MTTPLTPNQQALLDNLRDFVIQQAASESSVREAEEERNEEEVPVS